jgi:poly(A) polymerase
MRNAKFIIERLKENGYDAYVAGGAVRDMVIGVEPHDIDIVTSALPDDIERVFSDFKTLSVGKSFGVIVVMIGIVEYEIATMRIDNINSDGRRPDSVKFTSDLAQDAERRDFTMNGIFYDPISDKIIDFVGGKEDIKNGVVRFIGDPDSRIAEDKLRMLRGVRFAARFGSIEHESLEAIKRHAKEIHVVSKERIQEELIKMLKVGQPRRVINLIRDSGLMKEIIPEFMPMFTTNQSPEYHPEGVASEHTILVMEHLVNEPIELQLAGMLHDIGKPATTTIDPVSGKISSKGHAEVGASIVMDIMVRLKFSNDMISVVTKLVHDHMKIISVVDMKKATRKKFFAEDHFSMLLKLHEADRKGGCDRTDTLEYVKGLIKEYSKEPIMPKPFIDGRDLISLGLKEGREIGRVKEYLYDMQLEGLLLDREQALWVAKEVIEKKSYPCF